MPLMTILPCRGDRRAVRLTYGIIPLKFCGFPVDERNVIEPIHIPEVLRIPEKGSMGNRQPPPKRQPQLRPDHTPAIPLYRPDGAVDGIAESEDTTHIDLVG